jgi:hypothetical protein
LLWEETGLYQLSVYICALFSLAVAH